VTGATGFIGTRLTQALRARGADVRTFGRRAGDVDAVGDLLDRRSLDLAVRDCRVVFHLAGVVHQRHAASARDHEQVGRQGTDNLLAAAAAAEVTTLVFASSLAVYGSSFPAPVDERDPCHPDTPYGREKLAAEHLVLDWGRGGRAAVCLRPPMTYGPGVKGNLQRLASAVVRGWCPPIPRTPARRSLIHVDSLVEAMIAAAVDDRAAGRVFNVADDEALSAGEIYELLMRGAGHEPPGWRVPLALFRTAAFGGDCIAAFGGSAAFDSRAYRTLFAPAIARTDAIRETLGFHSGRRFSTSVTEVLADVVPHRRAA
jgi:nucleoside-diphosphate-sugar epimerase